MTGQDMSMTRYDETVPACVLDRSGCFQAQKRNMLVLLDAVLDGADVFLVDRLGALIQPMYENIRGFLARLWREKPATSSCASCN